MSIRVNCECGHWFVVRDELAGRKGRCVCGRTLRIPGEKRPHGDAGRSESVVALNVPAGTDPAPSADPLASPAAPPIAQRLPRPDPAPPSHPMAAARLDRPPTKPLAVPLEAPPTGGRRGTDWANLAYIAVIVVAIFAIAYALYYHFSRPPEPPE